MAADTTAKPAGIDVDAALAVWRQGDCVLGEQWFPFRFDPSTPITSGAVSVAKDDGEGERVDLAEDRVVGLVVVSQTCDIVRGHIGRPFVEVSPLVELDEHVLHDAKRGRRPNYGYIPALEAHRLAADLDRTMTVEKPVVARWTRLPGWTTDAEARKFAAALSRKRQRFAFPDDFNDFTGKLQSRMVEKHDKQTPEGIALRALREIRVSASPSWDAPEVTLMFWFIRAENDDDFNGESWFNILDKWLDLLPKNGRFVGVHAQVTTLTSMTAADYLAGDMLDLDHLSTR